ncbi:uncharacterized protein LAESUDRAFT_727489 [Laetiporus sulphureus 93-53]|uniref:Uncharacterized protein n=1 Tax=Laetiporus sulphureus 93-53 TaxID=1314785 RepID=A0A165DHX2_9APHY|nr:uncharacterized protein LAESUDRAFT_727489 [Laetiporus sulphureus 93-53]KZT04918.1 hypothetical protein LAESUDRAFT_727489 [Laetiporus sulphureus 93-53]
MDTQVPKFPTASMIKPTPHVVSIACTFYIANAFQYVACVGSHTDFMSSGTRT